LNVCLADRVHFLLPMCRASELPAAILADQLLCFVARTARRKVCVMYGNELPGRIGGILDEDGCTWADAKDTAGLHTPGKE
jgi:hypothetical protein